MTRTKSRQGGSSLLLDEFLPTWDFREEHRRRIEAPASRVRAAIEEISPRDTPFSGIMLALRLAPAAVLARQWPGHLARPWTEQLVAGGFVELANSDPEIVLGAVGRFWRFREEMVPLADADAFSRFDEPGYAKGALNFRVIVDDDGDGVVLTTETRVRATDARARRLFAPYWVPVRAVGGLMRLDMLLAVDRAARRSAAR